MASMAYAVVEWTILHVGLLQLKDPIVKQIQTNLLLLNIDIPQTAEYTAWILVQSHVLNKNIHKINQSAVSMHDLGKQIGQVPVNLSGTRIMLKLIDSTKLNNYDWILAKEIKITD